MTNLNPSELRTRKEFIWETLELAGHLLLQRFGTSLHISLKADRSLVTDADLASEDLILQRIRSYYPQDLILSEEAGASSPLPRHPGQGIWVVDPLDGTTNFSNHYEHFGVSIAYGVIDAKGDIDVHIGGIIDPCRGKLYLSQKNQGSSCNGKPIFVSKQQRLSASFLVTGFYYNKGGTLEMDVRRFAHIADQCQSVRGDGSATLDFCLVAEGIYDGFWEFGLQPWDTAAGALMVVEAGGTVRNYPMKDRTMDTPPHRDGTPQKYNPEQLGVIAGPRPVVEALTELIQSRPPILSDS